MYTEFHAASAFSFLEGASVPEELVEVCARLGMSGMALLDRDGVYGSPRFHLTAKKIGLKAHIGAEVTVSSFQFPVSRQKQVSSFEFQVSSGRAESSGAASDREVSRSSFFVSRQEQQCSPRNRNFSKLETRNSKLVGTTRVPLLVSSRTGYQNLCRLITRMKLRGPKDAEPEVIAARSDDLLEFAPGLICLTGDEHGPLAAALARGGVEEGRRTVERLMHIFGRENVYVELQRHHLQVEESRNQAAIAIARQLGLPLVATNGVRYATPERRQILDAFTALRNYTSLESAGRLLCANSERYIKSPAEMAELFADLPEAIANTQQLSSRLEFTLADLGYEFPRYPVPEGETMMSFLRQRTEEGFRQRYGRTTRDLRERARRQIERELALIEKLELAGYFLIVWDLVRFCREQAILVQGRGSAANSAVCYSLGITAVDPVGMDLLFERFLSEQRGEWPDIDLDLPSGDQRERVIQYVYQRYGTHGAAMTANVITYRGRLAAREMGKALGFDVETLDRLAHLVGSWEYHDPEDTMERQFRDAGFDLSHPRLRKFLELALAVQDLPRHLGQHSGGLVVCQGQLDSVVPLEPASMPGRVVLQWDKEDCADLGLIKVDLLGLGMMAVLEDSIKLIRESSGEEVDLAHLPPDDPEVYRALQKADTVGMFQIESRAQMSCLPRLRPTHFYDIVVQVAIIRPGPIVGQMVNPFLKRRQGREPVTYAHPSLEPVLARTLGVPLFQEQLLRIAMITAGFSGGEAEELRRAFGFKRSEKRMREVEVKLRAGMERNGISKEAQEQIIHSITSFALYGFPESHAASFALLAYASAYLKTHYLAAFTAALLNNQPMGFYHPSTVVKDAQRHGLKVRPIDVTKSDWLCTIEPVSSFEFQVSRDSETITDNAASVEKREIRKEKLAYVINPQPTNEHSKLETGNSKLSVRLGLRYVRGLREEVGRAIARERARRPFASIDDLVHRVPELRKDELVTLAQVGALNAVSKSFSKSVSSFEFQVSSNSVGDPSSAASVEKPETGNSKLASVGKRATRNEKLGPEPTHEHSKLETRNLKLHRRDALWQVEKAVRRPGELLEGFPDADEPSPLARMTAEERLVADFDGTGLTVGPHAMAYARAEMKASGIRSAIELESIPNGKWVKVAGCVIARQRPGTAHGFVFLSLEDETGIANAIVTPDMFDRHRLLLGREKFLLVEGILQKQDNVISVRAERVAPIAITRAATSSHDFH